MLRMRTTWKKKRGTKESEKVVYRLTNTHGCLPQGVDIAELGTRNGKVDFRRLDDHRTDQLWAVIADLRLRHASIIDSSLRKT